MKHVYLINNGSRAAQYGVGTYVKQLSTCLSELRTYRLTIVELDSEVDELQEEHEEGVRYLRIPAFHGIGPYHEAYSRNQAYLLCQYIEEKEGCIFHFNYLNHLLLAKQLKQRFGGSRFVVTIHYLNWCFTLQGNVSYFCSILLKNTDERSVAEENIHTEHQRDKKLLQYADQIICLSRATQHLFAECYAIPSTRLSLIYNGLPDEALFLSEEERKRKKEQLSFHADDKIVLFVGRLDAAKGGDTLLNAFRTVLNEVPDAHLLVVGDGEYNDYLKGCTDIWKKVTFTGKVSKETLYGFYQIADVGVMPSFHEQCSYVGIEMLMHGIPLMGTSAIGLGEMVLDELCLELKEQEDRVLFPVEKLSLLMVSVLQGNSKEKYRVMERQRYHERYSLDAMTQQVIACYEDL